MYNKLEEIIKKCKGNVLVFCLDNKLISYFDNNNNVNLFSISSNDSVDNRIFNRSKKKKIFNNSKSIKINKLRKKISKKSIDYIICNMNEMNNYYKYFIKDSIYLNCNLIYLYFDKTLDKDFFIKRYKRYNVEVECSEYKNGYILTIYNKDKNNNIIKDFIYLIKDTFYNIAETIGNILVS